MGGALAAHEQSRPPPGSPPSLTASPRAQDGEYDKERAEKENDAGVAAAAAGDFSEAHTRFTEAVRLAPSTAAYHSNRASAALRLGNAAGAAEDAEHALRLCPGHTAARLRAAKACTLLRRPQVRSAGPRPQPPDRPRRERWNTTTRCWPRSPRTPPLCVGGASGLSCSPSRLTLSQSRSAPPARSSACHARE